MLFDSLRCLFTEEIVRLIFAILGNQRNFQNLDLSASGISNCRQRCGKDSKMKVIERIIKNFMISTKTSMIRRSNYYY
jgi:hypothetical protein